MITIMAFTKNGVAVAEKLSEHFSDVFLYAPKKYCDSPQIISCEYSNEFMKHQFETSKALIFVSATGIAVRKIAPFIKNKAVDPAVVSVDEKSSYVIPLLSGHIGGANRLATKIAEILDATAVITTATDMNGVFAVDVWATENKYHIENIDSIKYISAALLNHEKIGIRSEFEVETELPQEFLQSWELQNRQCGLHIAKHFSAKKYFEYELRVIPKYFVVGLGCRRNISFADLAAVFKEEMKKNKIPIHLIKCIATIDLKKDELALKQLAFHHRLGLMFYTAEELSLAEGEFTKSEFVEQITTVDNVCERAAVLASNDGTILVRKIKSNGVTIAIAEENWSVKF